jgi:hypothetical protein
VGLTTPHRKNKFVTKRISEPRTWTDFLDKGPKPLMTVSRELSRYRLDLVGVQEVRWEGSGTVPAGEYTL